MGWYEYVRKYVWDDEKTPYFTGVAKLSRTQADKEIFAYAVLAGFLFAFLAVLTACLGLFGLAALTTQQRTKEIGIRKVLGASIGQVLLLLSKEYTFLVLVANLIAWPVAYSLMSRWLQTFAYHTGISLALFPAAGLLALVIAWLTVSIQIIRSATANPVKSLRYE